MKRVSSVHLAFLALSGSALFWAGNFIVGRALCEAIPPVWLTFGRWQEGDDGRVDRGLGNR